jgi:glycosyltransferase involved in cell wall biosynthesis
MSKKMKVLFLYTELAEYFLACIHAFVKKSSAEVHIVMWPVNKEAPFTFSFSGNVKVYERNQLSDRSVLDLVENISPDVIFCSGWVDTGYLSVCKKYRNKIPVIVGFDGKWIGSLKQRLGALFKEFTINKYFSHCWIPGKLQMEFAVRFGFEKKNILIGLYSCDYDFYHSIYSSALEFKRNKFPHRFIFVGRYYEFKGIKDLWQAFSTISGESPNDWELWCFGTGDISPVKHPQIKHFGFVQPKEMRKYISDSGVFILPSHVEPWGVVVHEFAAAGFPLICSDHVGAASTFLKENENGFGFQSKNIEQLKSIIRKTISLPDEKLFQMGTKSAELANQITPDKWADTLLSIIKQ